MAQLIPIHAAAEVNVAPSVCWEKRSIREYFETHRWARAASIVFSLTSCSVGLFLGGPLGSALGLLFGLAASFIVVRTKVRHERFERGGLP